MHGRMISILDLTIDMAGTRLLTDRSQRDGSPVYRNRSEVVKKAVDAVGVHRDDRPIAVDPRRSSSPKKSSGTPMKMLIAREMYKDSESKRNPPSVVARLMGLDDGLPTQQPVRDSHPRSKSVGSLRGRRQQEDVGSERPMSREVHSCSFERECKDVYEVRQPLTRTNRFDDQPLQRGRSTENLNEKRMDLVRQKFTEAKQLATDEKLLHSKEFQDALEVLNSNKDLFLKFLEEPSSLFSKHIKELRGIPSPPPPTKRITILKPTNSSDTKIERQVKNRKGSVATIISEQDLNKSIHAPEFSRPKAQNVSSPTRIVVLRPSPIKVHGRIPVSTTSTPISWPEPPQGDDSYRDSGTGEANGSREIAKEITRQIRASASGHRRDESLLSLVLSSEYAGDGSSFGKSDNEYTSEVDNFNDSEVMSPCSRRSWDYRSPSSLSSFNRASYSPESPVITEAKKRLSERWAMVASNSTTARQDPTQVWRGTSTLGEMLAIPEIKKEEGKKDFSVSSNRSFSGDEDLRVASTCLSIDRTKDGECGGGSPRSLPRSKSVPVSSSAFENIGLNAEASDHQISKSNAPKKPTKIKSGKSSIKGRVSSFFSWNKNLDKQKTTSSPLVDSGERLTLERSNSVGEFRDISRSTDDSLHEEPPLMKSEEESCSASTTSGNCGPKSSKSAATLENMREYENLSVNKNKLQPSAKTDENQDQPSPTSILDALFDEDVQKNESPSTAVVIDAADSQALPRSAKIETVARSLSWVEAQIEESSPILSRFLIKDEEEQERFMFIKGLLSSVGLEHEKASAVFTKWHSPESPLDPSLLVEFLDQKQEAAKSRTRRSSQRLLFDCVNAALLDIGRDAIFCAYPWAGQFCNLRQNASTVATVTDKVWEFVQDRFSKRVLCEIGDGGLLVDGLLRKEAEGAGWEEMMQAAMGEVGEEIGRWMLDDLVRETFTDLTDGYLS